MDGGAPLGVRLGLPQDLRGDRGGVSLPEEEKADHVHDRVTFGPPEVAVRRLVCGVAEIEKNAAMALGTTELLGPPLALDTEHGKARCPGHGRGLEIESTADVLLTTPPMF